MGGEVGMATTPVARPSVASRRPGTRSRRAGPALPFGALDMVRRHRSHGAVGRILVGTSGWQYDHWRGVLYPEGLPQRSWLARYAERFATVELNATFYRLATPAACERWRQATPAGFAFAVKGSRFITHVKRLGDPARPLRRFFRPLERLGPKLRVVLWQLPPGMRPDLPRLERFLRRLPVGVRHAFEFRHPAWYHPAVCDLLDRHGAAFCEHD